MAQTGREGFVAKYAGTISQKREMVNDIRIFVYQELYHETLADAANS
jgi:hypothetical protein